MQHFLEKAVVS